jgi:hypothetical protein
MSISQGPPDPRRCAGAPHQDVRLVGRALLALLRELLRHRGLVLGHCLVLRLEVRELLLEDLASDAAAQSRARGMHADGGWKAVGRRGALAGL